MFKSIVRQQKSRSVIQRWFASYFLLLLIPLVVSMGMYLKIEAIVEQEIERSDNLVLLQVQKELDNVFNAQTRLCIELAFDEDIDALIANPEEKEQLKLKQKIHNKLRTMRISNEYRIVDLFVYFYELDTVVTSNAVFDGKTFYYSYYTGEYQSYDEWTSLFRANMDDQYAVFEVKDNSSSTSTIIFSQTIPISNWDMRPRAMVGTIFNMDKIEQVAEELKSSNGRELTILDDENNIFFASAEATPKKSSDEFQNDGLYIKSGIKGWRYLVSESRDGYNNQIVLVRILIFLYVVFTLLIGSLMSKKFIKQNYAPIANLMDALKTKRSHKEECNEFEIIFNEVSKILSERNDISDELQDVKMSFRKNFLSGLLAGRIKDKCEANELGEKFGVHFESENFAVVLLNIEDYESLFEDEDDLSAEQRYTYYQLIIVNIMEELLRKKHECYVFEADGMMAALVGCKDTADTATLADISGTISYGIGVVEKHFGVLPSASVSNIHKSFRNISECYYEAYVSMCNMKVNEQAGVIRYADMIRQKYPDLHVCTEQKIYLSNFIQTGEKEKACEILRGCFEQLATKSNFETELLRCNMFNLLDVIFKAAEDRISVRTDFSIEEYLERLLRCDSVEIMEELMYEVCDHVCDFAKDEVAKNSNLVEKVKKLVEENYEKHGFGVMEIGEHFGLAPSYVSKIFKNNTKELLADYISRMRINRAKILMRETNYTIEAISGKVGYLNSKIFSRAFKKVEGILPSQYKALAKKDEN